MNDKYLSVITNFGCHYSCPYCIVKNNHLNIPKTTLLRNDFMVGSLSEEILNMTVTGIENDENIENTVVVYVTDEED